MPVSRRGQARAYNNIALKTNTEGEGPIPGVRYGPQLCALIQRRMCEAHPVQVLIHKKVIDTDGDAGAKPL